MTKEQIDRTMSKIHYSLLTGILFWGGLVVVSSLYVTIPLISIFARTFDLSPEEASWTSSAFSLSYAVGFLVFGSLTERLGRKNIMVVGLSILTIVTFIISLLDTYRLLVAFRAMQGFAAASFAPAALAYVVKMFPEEKRVTTIGFLSTGFLMAGIVGQLISSFLYQYVGWKGVFVFLAGLYCVSLFLLAKLPRDQIGKKPTHSLRFVEQIQKLLTQKELVFCFAITFTLLLTFVGMYTVLGSDLSQSFGMNPQQVLSVRTMGIFGMFLSPFAGILIRRFQIHTVLRVGLTLALFGLAIMGIYHNVVLLITMSVVYVAGISLTIPTLIVLIGQLGGSARDFAISLYTFILFIGATLGPIMAVRILQISSYPFTFEVLAVLLGISLIFAFFIKEPNLKVN